MLSRCLSMDSTVRPSALECMQHRYFDGLWDEEDVVLYDGTPVRFMLQSREPSADLLRLGFLHAVAQFHPEAAPVVRALSARLDVPEAALG